VQPPHENSKRGQEYAHGIEGTQKTRAESTSGSPKQDIRNHEDYTEDRIEKSEKPILLATRPPFEYRVFFERFKVPVHILLFSLFLGSNHLISLKHLLPNP
jgi:hypothetical protein